MVRRKAEMTANGGNKKRKGFKTASLSLQHLQTASILK